jgi:spore coat protein U-like protein
MAGAVVTVAASMLPGLALATADCSVSVTGMAFGVYDPTLATPDDSTGSVTVTCNYLSGGASHVSYTVSMSAGTSGSYLQRSMTAGAASLDYNLYLDPARTLVLGDGSAGTGVLSGAFSVGPGVGNGTRTATYTVYGRLPAQQPVDQGTFGDALVLTLSF